MEDIMFPDLRQKLRTCLPEVCDVLLRVLRRCELAGGRWQKHCSLCVWGRGLAGFIVSTFASHACELRAWGDLGRGFWHFLPLSFNIVCGLCIQCKVKAQWLYFRIFMHQLRRFWLVWLGWKKFLYISVYSYIRTVLIFFFPDFLTIILTLNRILIL
jgi:hypothetical protein